MENENNFLNHYSQKFLFLNADQFQNDWENFKLFFSLYSFENKDLDNWKEWKNWDKFSNEEILSRKKRARAPTSADLNQKKPSKNGINACEKLQNYCLKISNNSLNYVGTSGNALSATDWGYVVADNIICPNWHYPRGKIVGSGSSLDVFIGGIVIDLATSGPMKGNYPTMISGSGFSTPKSGISSAAGKAAPVVVNRETPTHVIPQAFAKVSSVEKPFSYADQVRGILDKGLPNEKPIVNIEGATGERKISLADILKAKLNIESSPNSSGSNSLSSSRGSSLNLNEGSSNQQQSSFMSRSASEANISSKDRNLDLDRRFSLVEKQINRANLEFSKNSSSEHKFSYSNLVKSNSGSPSASGSNISLNKSNSSSTISLNSNLHRVPSRAFSLTEKIDINKLTRFYNHDNKIKNAPKNAIFYKMDIPINADEIGGTRDAKRVIIDLKTGRRWYTSDHYQTFIDMELKTDVTHINLDDLGKPKSKL